MPDLVVPGPVQGRLHGPERPLGVVVVLAPGLCLPLEQEVGRAVSDRRAGARGAMLLRQLGVGVPPDSLAELVEHEPLEL